MISFTIRIASALATLVPPNLFTIHGQSSSAAPLISATIVQSAAAGAGTGAGSAGAGAAVLIFVPVPVIHHSNVEPKKIAGHNHSNNSST